MGPEESGFNEGGFGYDKMPVPNQHRIEGMCASGVRLPDERERAWRGVAGLLELGWALGLVPSE